MDRTQCTLMDAAKKIKEYFLRIGLPVTLDNFLTSEEYETLRSAMKGTLKDECDQHWKIMNQIDNKVYKLVAEAPALKLHAISEFIRKKSLNSKPKFKLIGFEFDVFTLLKKVNEFISSDECKEFIDFDFKITERHNFQLIYSDLVKYRAPATSDDNSQKRSVVTL